MDPVLIIVVIVAFVYLIFMFRLDKWMQRARPSKDVFSGNLKWKYLLYFLGLKSWKNGVGLDGIPQFEEYFFRCNLMTIYTTLHLIGFGIYGFFTITWTILESANVVR